jgi:hypothetical protein
MTGQIERNIEGAKATIDTLRMLKEKSKGNLSKEEEELLNGSISQLEINYIAEAKKEKENIVESKDKHNNNSEKAKHEHNEHCGCGHEHDGCGCSHHDAEPESDIKWDKK